jgi:hypothetical protein
MRSSSKENDYAKSYHTSPFDSTILRPPNPDIEIEGCFPREI